MKTKDFRSLILVTVLFGSHGLVHAQRSRPPIIENTTYSRPVGSSRPVFLRDTLEVQLQTKETYWKVPNQNYYTSWVPRANFHLLYDGSAKLRYTPIGSTRTAHSGSPSHWVTTTTGTSSPS